MTNTPILAIPQVASNQNQKETTINTAIAILEAAMNDNEVVNFSGGDVIVSPSVFNRNFLLIASGQTQARLMSVPGNVRWFAVQNDGAHNIVVDIQGQAFPGVDIEPGKRVLLVSTGTAIVAVSQGISEIFSLSDVDGSQSPSTGQVLVWDGSRFIAGDRPADISVDYPGSPGSAAVLARRIFSRSLRLPTNLLLSQGVVETAPTALAVFDVQVNGSSIGEISFAAGETAATFSAAASTTINPGDVLEIIAPASPDATLSHVSISIWAAYI